MVNRVSTTGVNLAALLSMQASKEQSDILTNQLTTGFKYQRFQDYGTDARHIISFQNTINQREAYIHSITMVQPITDAYDKVFSHLDSVATNIMKSADPLSIKRDDFPGATNALAESWMVDIQSSLNTEIGGRFIFSGTNYTSESVKELRDMSTYSMYNSSKISEMIDEGLLKTENYVTPELDADGNLQYDTGGNLLLNPPDQLGITDTIETSDSLPQYVSLQPLLDSSGNLQFDSSDNIILQYVYQSYHEQYTGQDSTNSRAWEQMKVTIDDRQTYAYGQTATDTAFQKLINAALMLRSAAQTQVTSSSYPPGATPSDEDIAEANWNRQRDLLRQAYNLAEEARTEIRNLQTENGGVMARLKDMSDVHTRFVALSQTSEDKLNKADENEAAITQSALNQMMQASYTSIAKRFQMSLVNFLN